MCHTKQRTATKERGPIVDLCDKGLPLGGSMERMRDSQVSLQITWNSNVDHSCSCHCSTQLSQDIANATYSSDSSTEQRCYCHFIGDGDDGVMVMVMVITDMLVEFRLHCLKDSIEGKVMARSHLQD